MSETSHPISPSSSKSPSDGCAKTPAAEAEVLFEDVLSVVEEAAGVLNFNDGLLVVLQRLAIIDDVASLDNGFDVVEDFRRIGG